MEEAAGDRATGAWPGPFAVLGKRFLVCLDHFSSLEHWLTYWKCGLPEADELLATSTADGGTWTQSFAYSDLAHLIIPARFYWETSTPEAGFQSGYKPQDIVKLSGELSRLEIPHRLSERVLEIKLY